MILHVQYRLCFTNVYEMGGIYDKNLFTLGKKLDLLKNLLLTVEREVQFLCKNLFFLVAGMLRAA